MPVGQRSTKQRAAVNRILHEIEEFRTAQQIHELLRERGEAVGLTTVYRTLQAMADAGHVDMVRTLEGENAYRRCESTHHHHHLLCTACGVAVEIADPDVQTWTEQVAQKHGFTQVSHDLEIYGLCPACTTAGR